MEPTPNARTVESYRALRTEAEFTDVLSLAGLQTEWTERSHHEEETGWLCLLAQRV